jgi:hypothetical protein
VIAYTERAVQVFRCFLETLFRGLGILPGHGATAGHPVITDSVATGFGRAASRLPVGSRTVGAGFLHIVAGISNGLAGIGLIDDRGHKQYLALALKFRRTCTACGKLGNKCRGSPDETERYALWVRRNDEVRHLFPPLASGGLGFAGLAVDFFDGDILTADSAADGDVALAQLLAQRDFLDHMSLLG